MTFARKPISVYAMTNAWNPLEIIARQEAERAGVTAMLRERGVIDARGNIVPRQRVAREYVGRHRKPETAMDFRGVDAEGFAVYYGPSLGW